MKNPQNLLRSQGANASFSNQFGTVQVYTRRHINGCPLTGRNANHCACPKHLDIKPRAGVRLRQKAATPSFTEACELAQKILDGWRRDQDPDIQAARKLASPAPGITVETALTRYYAILHGRKLAPGYLGGSITPVFDRRKPRPHNRGRRVLNLSLLDFLDQTSREPVRVEQVTAELLDDWAAGWESNDLTSKLWRTVATSFFRWCMGRGYLSKLPVFAERMRVKAGNRCGYFTDEQLVRISEALPFYQSLTIPLPPHYHERLAAFIALGRWGGMAVADAVRFSPQANLGANNVLTYRRVKSKQVAKVLLDPAVARRLRSIPAEPGSDRDQPLRFPEKKEESSRGIWRERFQKLCLHAGIQEVETEIGTRRKPHPHMLRDTFAIDAITRGVSLENVSKMLGHATVEMTQRAYLFWIEKRLDHCIEDQRAALTRVQVSGATIEDAGPADRLRRPLVH